MDLDKHCPNSTLAKHFLKKKVHFTNFVKLPSNIDFQVKLKNTYKTHDHSALDAILKENKTTSKSSNSHFYVCPI